MSGEGIRPVSENTFLQVRDPILKGKLSAMELPSTMRSFARYSQEGLHLIGVESKEKKTAPPIVALPGFAHANWSYVDLISSLGKEGIEIVAPSFPGDGESKPFKKAIEDLRVEDYVSAVKALLTELDRPVILLGHSFGGLVAQKVASDEEIKSSIQGLVLINSVPPSNLRGRTTALAGTVFLPKEDTAWKENLFSGANESDKQWWFSELDRAQASIAVMNDYVVGKSGGEVDPTTIRVPILELSGSNDLNSLTNLNQISDSISEFSHTPERQRTSITDLYKEIGEHDENAWLKIVENGSHDMMLGRHAKQVTESIKSRFYIRKPENKS